MNKGMECGAKQSISRFIVFIGFAVLMVANARADDDITDKNLRLDVGYTHWASDTFRKPRDGKDLSFGIGYRLPVHWLELQGRYEWAHIKASPTISNYSAIDGKRVNFLAAGIALVANDFTRGDQRVILSYSISALRVSVDGQSNGIGLSSGPSVEWLFDGKQGMISNLRKQGYRLPSSVTTDYQVDFTAELGYVRRF